MFSPEDRIKIEMDVDVEDALRALVVLGRSNGSSSAIIYNTIKKALDPHGIYTPPDSVYNELGTIQYVRIEPAVKHHFFNIHQKKVELEEAVKELLDAQERVDQLKLEIGE